MTPKRIIQFLQSLDDCKVVNWITINPEQNVINVGYINNRGAVAEQMCAYSKHDLPVKTT